jgi:single-stranded DNA-binding protein
MQNDTNKWIGEGIIHTELTLRTTDSGYPVANFLLKVSSSYKTKQEPANLVWKTNDFKNLALYHEKSISIPITVWDEKAKKIVTAYKRNDKVRVIGRLNPIKTGPKHYEIILDDISMIRSN